MLKSESYERQESLQRIRGRPGSRSPGPLHRLFILDLVSGWTAYASIFGLRVVRLCSFILPPVTAPGQPRGEDFSSCTLVE